MDRVTNISYRTASGTLIRRLSYQYDDLGMITNRMTEGGGQTTEVGYEYDSLNRLIREGSDDSWAEYSYDLAGNRLSKIRTDNQSPITVNCAFGVGNRLASWRAASATGFESQRNVRVSGNSSEPIGTDDRWGALYISNRTSSISATPDISGAGFQSNNFPLEFGTQEIVAAIRDQAGNVGYATNAVFLTVVTNAQFGYNAAGCITNITHTGTGDYSASVALDWDERYRLTSVEGRDGSPQPSVFYTYDVLGRKVSRTVAGGGDPGSTNAEYYVYNGNQVVADLGETGNLLRTYTWGPGVDNLLAMTLHPAITNSTDLTISTPLTLYPLKDHQNSVLAFTDSSGTVVESYEYDAWGKVLSIKDGSGNVLTSGIGSPTSAVGNRYLFQGREYDSATGLYYFRARWYDPVTGRWLSKDPIGIAGGLNLYAFCENNPVNFVDPYGLVNWGAAAGAAADLATSGNPFSYKSSFHPFQNEQNNAGAQQRNANSAYPPGTDVLIDSSKGPTTVPPAGSSFILPQNSSQLIPPYIYQTPKVPQPGDPDFIGPVKPSGWKE